MKVIDGKDAILGRLASYVAKEALKGEEIAILNCEKIIITGSKRNIKENFEAKRKRVGSTQKGPKVSRLSERIVKRTIRGMLPNYREGRGREALKRIKCYVGEPAQFRDYKKTVFEEKGNKKEKFMIVKELSKQ